MNEFEIKSEVIAMESLVAGLPVSLGTPTFLKVKGIAKAIAGWAREKVRPELRIAVVSYAKIRKDMEQSNMNDLAGVKVTVPRGLKTYLNVYVEELFDSFLMVENINNELLSPFSTWLSMMLASPRSLSESTAVNDLKGYKEIPVDKVRDNLSKFVDPTSRRDQIEVKDVYPSLTVMKISWDNINALTTRYLETNPTKIIKTVQDIAGKIDRLIQVVEENEGSFSGQAATIMAKLVAQMATAVDMYGQIGVLVREVAVAGSRHVGELEKSFKTGATRARSMALESLDLENPMISVAGRQVDFDSLKRIIWRYGNSTTLDIDQVDWMVEEGLAVAYTEGDEQSLDYESRALYAVRIGDELLPVDNLNAVGMAVAAGHQSVLAQIIDHSKLVSVLDNNELDKY